MKTTSIKQMNNDLEKTFIEKNEKEIKELKKTIIKNINRMNNDIDFINYFKS